MGGKCIFSSTSHSCLPSLPTAPFFFIFSLIQSSHPRKSGHHLAWRALSAFHYDPSIPTSAIRFHLYPYTFGYTGPLPCRTNEPSGCVHRYLCQRLITKTDCSTFLVIRHLSLTGDVLSAFSYVWPAHHCRPIPMLVVSLHQQRMSPYIL